MCEKFELTKVLMEEINNSSIEKISIEEKILVYRKDILNMLKEKNVTLQEMEKVLGITTEEKKFNNRLVYDLGKKFKLEEGIIKQVPHVAKYEIPCVSENKIGITTSEFQLNVIKKLILKKAKPLYRLIQEENLDPNNTPLKIKLNVEVMYNYFASMFDTSNVDKFILDVLFNYSNTFSEVVGDNILIDDSLITCIETSIVDRHTYHPELPKCCNAKVEVSVEYDAAYMKNQNSLRTLHDRIKNSKTKINNSKRIGVGKILNREIKENKFKIAL